MIRTLLATLLLPSFAFAQEAAGSQTLAGSSLASMAPLLIIFFVFYFLLIRPQQRRVREHQTMLDALKKGDEVVTRGGIIGKVVKSGEDGVILLDTGAGEVRVAKAYIDTVVSKTGPAKPASKKKSNGTRNDNVVLDKERVANDN